MKRLAFLLIVVLIPSALADQHATYWPKDKLAGYSSSLDSKVEDNVAIERLGEFGSHFALMVHRTGTGTSESHDTDTDFYVVQAGQATLHVGGEIMDPQTVSPGEVRGTSIKGGKTMKLKAGDTVNIPPTTPHHVVVAPGESITYLIVKIHK